MGAKKIYSLISTVLITLIVIVAFLLAGIRLIGITPYTVLSGSMEPKYPVGSIIYVENVKPQDVKIGDALTFSISNGTIVTHSVIDIIEAEDPAQRQFITQGLANDTPDGAPVYASSIIGRPIFCIPYLGYVSNFVQHPPGTYVTIGFLIAVLLISFVPDILSSGESDEKKKEEAKPDEAEPHGTSVTPTSSDEPASESDRDDNTDIKNKEIN